MKIRHNTNGSPQVPKKLVPWPRGKTYASVNNFGFGGTNAHVVLERAPTNEHDGEHNTEETKRRVYIVSGYDKRAASERTNGVLKYLHLNPPALLDTVTDDIAYTLGQRRSALPWRVAVTASFYPELVENLSHSEPVRASREPTVGFVFTGQGAQWHGMGKELLDRYPIFQKTLETVDASLQTLGAKFSIIGMKILNACPNQTLTMVYRRTSVGEPRSKLNFGSVHESTRLHGCSIGPCGSLIILGHSAKVSGRPFEW